MAAACRVPTAADAVAAGDDRLRRGSNGDLHRRPGADVERRRGPGSGRSACVASCTSSGARHRLAARAARDERDVGDAGAERRGRARAPRLAVGGDDDRRVAGVRRRRRRRPRSPPRGRARRAPWPSGVADHDQPRRRQRTARGTPRTRRRTGTGCGRRRRPPAAPPVLGARGRSAAGAARPSPATCSACRRTDSARSARRRTRRPCRPDARSPRRRRARWSGAARARPSRARTAPRRLGSALARPARVPRAIIAVAPPSPACASHTREGVHGMSMWRTP